MRSTAPQAASHTKQAPGLENRGRKDTGLGGLRVPTGSPNLGGRGALLGTGEVGPRGGPALVTWRENAGQETFRKEAALKLPEAEPLSEQGRCIQARGWPPPSGHLLGGPAAPGSVHPASLGSHVLECGAPSPTNLASPGGPCWGRGGPEGGRGQDPWSPACGADVPRPHPGLMASLIRAGQAPSLFALARLTDSRLAGVPRPPSG